MTKKFIWVHHKLRMQHHYPTAPDSVHFLRYPHSHMFEIKLTVEVFHDDRELEFIMVERILKVAADKLGCTHNGKSFSCEMFGDDLHAVLCTMIPSGNKRKMIIEVSEDGVAGSRAIYSPDR